MAEGLPQIEYSPMCGRITRDGETVEVQIYRMRDGDPSWSLEVVDSEGGSTVWADLFETDKAAYVEFYNTMEREGIRCFRQAPADTHLQ